jgi:hypothetical protein
MVLAPALTLVGVVAAWSGAPGRWGAVLKAGELDLAWASALAVVQALLVTAALQPLGKLLGQVSTAQLFPPQAARLFGRFAACLLAAVLVHSLVPAVLGAWSAYGRDGSQLVLDLDGADFLSLLVTAVLWLVARFFAEAARLEEDQQSIV